MKASRYARAPAQSTILNPTVIANIIVKTGASTERQAFIAHAQGISSFCFCPRSFMPIGKGMPMKNPGMTNDIEIIMFFVARE